MVQQNAIIAIILVVLFAFISVVAYAIFRLQKSATGGQASLGSESELGIYDRRQGRLQQELVGRQQAFIPPRLGREEVPPIGIRGLPRSP